MNSRPKNPNKKDKREIALLFLGILVFAAIGLAEQSPEDCTACQFSLSLNEPVKPVVTGPEDIVKRVFILPQPDSPVEVTAIDFEGTIISFSYGRLSKKFCHKIKLRNRTDRLIRQAEVTIPIVFVQQSSGGSASGSGARLSTAAPEGLPPGQEVEVVTCRRGFGTGSAPHDNFRLAVMVDWVEFAGCRYYPAVHIPRQLYRQ